MPSAELADLWPILVHESGHCVVAHRRGMRVTRLEIVDEGGGLNGYSFIDHEQARLSDYLAVLLAGSEAEREILGHDLGRGPHPRSDVERIEQAVSQAGLMGRQELMQASQKARRLVRTYHRAIVGLAGALMEIAYRGMVGGRWADVCVDGDQLATLLGGDELAILRLNTG